VVSKRRTLMAADSVPSERPVAPDVSFAELLRYANDPGLRLFAIGVAVAVYAAELTSFTLSIDEELFAYVAQPGPFFIAQGRWTMALLSSLLPPLSTTPFLPTAMFCAGLVVSGLVLAGCFAESRLEARAFIGFFVSCPIWLHVAEFNVTSWGIGAGLCLAAGAVALLRRNRYSTAIGAALATTVAIGIHQSLLAFVVCGSLLSASLRMLEAQPASPTFLARLRHHVGPLAISWSLAALLYYGTTQLLLLLSNEHLRYVDTFVHLGEFATNDTSSAAIDRTVDRLALLLIGSDATFLRWRWGLASILLAWIGAVAAAVRAARTARGRLSATGLGGVFLLGSALAAVGPLIVSAGTAPLRTLAGLPILYGMGAASALKHKAARRAPLWLIFYFALFINSWISATLFNADAIARDRDRVMATQLATRINELAPDLLRGESRPFILVGKWAHEVAGPAARAEVFGTSFFEHDDGQVNRVASYLRLLGVRGLRPERLSKARSRLLQALEALPSWPAPGSVTLLGDLLVVKVGPLSRGQRSDLAR
jgi:hypothetical protein